MAKLPPVHQVKLYGGKRCSRIAVALPRNEAVAIAGDDGIVRITGVRRNENATREIYAHNGRIGGVVELERDFVASCGIDGMLRVWKLNDIRRPRDEHNLRSLDGLTTMCALRPSRIMVGTGSGQLILYRFDIYAQRLLPLGRVTNAHERRINNIHVHRDLFVTASNDQTAALWTVSNCDRVAVFPHKERVFSVAIGEHHVAAGVLDRVFLYHNRGPDFPLVTVLTTNCGVVWRMLPIAKDKIMYTGNDCLNFSTIESKNLVAQVKTSAVHVLDANVLPDGRVVYAGNNGENCGIIELGRNLAEDLRTYLHGDDPPSSCISDPRIGRMGRQVKIPNDVKVEDRGRPFSRNECRDPRLRGREHPDNDGNRMNYNERRNEHERRGYNDHYQYRQVNGNCNRQHDGPYRRGYDDRYQNNRNSSYGGSKNEHEREGLDGSNEYRQKTEKANESNGGQQHTRTLTIMKPLAPSKTESRNEKLTCIEGPADASKKSKDATEPGEIKDEQPNEEGVKRESNEQRDPLPNGGANGVAIKNEPSSASAVEKEPSERGSAVKREDTEGSSVVSSQKPSGGDCETDPSSDMSRANQGASSPQKSQSVESNHAANSSEDSLEAELDRWRMKGVSKQVAEGLETKGLAGMMAAFMLRYRTSWKNKYEPLRNCLYEFFDENFLMVDDIVGDQAICSDELSNNVIEALKSDQRIGAKMGLVKGVQRFLEAVKKRS